MQKFVQIISDESGYEHLIRKNEWVLLNFFASWCGPCKSLAPTFEKIALENASLASARVDVEKVSVLATQFRIRGVPTLVLIHKGSPIDTLLGAYSRESIENWLHLNTKLVSS